MDRDATRAWWAGLVGRVAVAVLVSAGLSLLTSIVLIGLPHGWETATSWADITLRSSWIAGFVVPVTIATHLMSHFRRRRRHPAHDRDRPRSFKRGGKHR
ncbi:hypothetical protein ACFRMN_26035 [Streptomyces sp. NPDC056835]|uniref:hypothetical protein n=1 Tax=Streptomyces sp. NPDC056835 TaxID=3345956 RepID=UPI00367FCF70